MFWSCRRRFDFWLALGFGLWFAFRLALVDGPFRNGLFLDLFATRGQTFANGSLVCHFTFTTKISLRASTITTSCIATGTGRPE